MAVDEYSSQPVRAFDALWDYDRPAETESKFRGYLNEHESEMSTEERMEMKTQIARTLSLLGEFEAAHQILDEVETALTDDTPVADVRCLLERSRTFNSAGEKENAEATFMKTWDQARSQGFGGYAVDAAHMLGIVHGAEPETALKWNHAALDLAKSSPDPAARTWRGSLCNNLGWAHHASGEYVAALGYFEQALIHHEAEGKAGDIRVARGCVARGLRSLDRIEEALAIQHELESEIEIHDDPDGFVYEEIAECLHALDREREAKAYFRRAYEILSRDAGLLKHEAARLERLKTLALVDS